MENFCAMELHSVVLPENGIDKQIHFSFHQIPYQLNTVFSRQVKSNTIFKRQIELKSYQIEYSMEI